LLFEAETTSLKSENWQLKSQIESLKNEFSDLLKSEITKWENLIKEILEKANLLKSEHMQCKILLSWKDIEINSLKGQLTYLDNDILDLKKEIRKLKAEKEDLFNEISKMKVSIVSGGISSMGDVSCLSKEVWKLHS